MLNQISNAPLYSPYLYQNEAKTSEAHVAKASPSEDSVHLSNGAEAAASHDVDHDGDSQ